MTKKKEVEQQSSPKEKTLLDLLNESDPQVKNHITSLQNQVMTLRRASTNAEEEIVRNRRIIDRLLSQIDILTTPKV